jgi:hypothetical protein
LGGKPRRQEIRYADGDHKQHDSRGSRRSHRSHQNQDLVSRSPEPTDEAARRPTEQKPYRSVNQPSGCQHRDCRRHTSQRKKPTCFHKALDLQFCRANEGLSRVEANRARPITGVHCSRADEFAGTACVGGKRGLESLSRSLSISIFVPIFVSIFVVPKSKS